MELEHAFPVPVGIDDAWRVLLDVERVAPCMPGATLEAVDGNDFSGRVKVKVGPMQITYTGSASFVEIDEEHHLVVIDARGRETRGSGTATATVRAHLAAQGSETTQVRVTTDLAVTGKPAQFGRSVLADVGEKLIGRFADCLADQLAGAPDVAAPEDQQDQTSAAPDAPAAAAPAATPPTGVNTAPTPTRPTPPPPDNAIDLLEVAGAPVLKRLAAPVAIAILLVLAVRWLRR